MTNILRQNYLGVRPIELAMQKFAQRFSAEQSILDIGCGKMPYKKFFRSHYIGLDPVKEVHPDIVASAWDIPRNAAEFDGIIMNQSLEHIARLEDTISEVFRVLKPGGHAIITVPQTVRNHSTAIPSIKAPYKNFNTQDHPFWHVDYYRFTKFGLIHLFRDFEIVSLKETTGYIGTLCQLVNYFFASLGAGPLFIPIYFVMNCVGIVADSIFGLINANSGIAQKFHHFTYMSLTTTLILIVQKPPAQTQSTASQPERSSAH